MEEESEKVERKKKIRGKEKQVKRRCFLPHRLSSHHPSAGSTSYSLIFCSIYVASVLCEPVSLLLRSQLSYTLPDKTLHLGSTSSVLYLLL